MGKERSTGEIVAEIDGIRERVLDLIIKESGIIADDGCWIYRDKESGAMVKVSRPRGVMAAMEGCGESLYLLDSIDVADAGMILCVYEDVVGRWTVSNYFVHKGGFDTEVVYLPKARVDKGEDKLDFYLKLANNDDRCGGWKVMMPGNLAEPSKLKFYRKLEAKLGLAPEPKILRQFKQWIKIKRGNRKRNS